MDMTMHSTRPGLLDAVYNDLVRTNAAHSFHQDGFAEFEVDPKFLLNHVGAIKDGLTRMTDGADKEQFNSVVLFKDEVGEDHDSGLDRRHEDEQKWFFHVYPDTREHYRRTGAPVDAYKDFFDSMEAVNEFAFDVALRFAELWDRKHGLRPSLAERIQKSCAVTRALRYLERPGEEDEPDAHLHFDRCCISLHQWSNLAGLKLYKPDDTMVTIQETAHNRMALFPGKKWAAVHSGRYGPGTPHGVKNLLRKIAGIENRFALVTFVHCALTPQEAAWLLARKDAFKLLLKNCKI